MPAPEPEEAHLFPQFVLGTLMKKPQIDFLLSFPEQ